VSETFSTDYPFHGAKESLESKYAITASKALATNNQHSRITVKDYQVGLIESIKNAEEPIYVLQSVLFYLLYKEDSAKTCELFINGQGAESTFGLFLHEKIWNLKQSPIQKLFLNNFSNNLLKFLVNSTNRGKGIYRNFKLHKSYEKTEGLNDPDHIIWDPVIYGYGAGSDISGLKKSPKNIIENRFSNLEKYLNATGASCSIHDVISILDIITVSKAVQEEWSKLAGASNKKIYFPFCEEEVINYSMSIPWEIKNKEMKLILNNMAKILNIPDFIITRKKIGAAVGHEGWAITKGPFESLIKLCKDIFDYKYITKFLNGDMTDSMTFWNIINYCIWKRLFIFNQNTDELINEIQ
jgi:asparagine synthetase B (glutamine-hydrolysing)